MSAPQITPSPASTAPSPALLRALRRALRPLVRLMIARGVTLPALVEMLKGLLVDVADKEFGLAGKPPTDSRVSLMTGVHRKDVSRLRRVAVDDAEQAPQAVSLGAQLVAFWLGTPEYVDDQGQPLPLARFASDGGARSFEALVARINSDIRSRVVLDEWLRLGIARLDDERRVCLNTAAFVPAAGEDEKAFYLGHNLHDHAAAAANNLIGGQPPFMERCVHYDALSLESVQALQRQSESAGMKALLAINRAALAAEEHDATAPGPRHRITFGVYAYAQPVEEAGAADLTRSPGARA